jgi:hypothetical protein
VGGLRTGNVAIGACAATTAGEIVHSARNRVNDDGPHGAAVRFAGADRHWDGCHDFGKLSPREARRTQPARIGPRTDELGTFTTLIARLGPGSRARVRGDASGAG